MPHGWAILCVQMPYGEASELMYFYRICNSSNHFLTAKTATFSHTGHVLLFIISCLQVETIVQIFAHVGVEPYATFKVWKTKLFLTMPHHGLTFFGKLNAPPCGWRSEKVTNKCLVGVDGMGALGIDQASIKSTLCSLNAKWFFFFFLPRWFLLSPR